MVGNVLGSIRCSNGVCVKVQQLVRCRSEDQALLSLGELDPPGDSFARSIVGNHRMYRYFAFWNDGDLPTEQYDLRISIGVFTLWDGFFAGNSVDRLLQSIGSSKKWFAFDL